MSEFVDQMTDQYSEVTLIATVIVALLSFPLGLAVPAYLYLKASNNTASQLSGLEIWTAIIGGIFGIALVEIAGRTGAYIFWTITALGIVGLLLFTLLLAGFVVV